MMNNRLFFMLILEHAKELQIDPNDYRIICANGSLAQYTGFDVDDDCPLTIIVDGEIVVSRESTKTDGIINALASFDKYFQNDPDFKMFSVFDGTKDLLFKVGFTKNMIHQNKIFD